MADILLSSPRTIHHIISLLLLFLDIVILLDHHLNEKHLLSTLILKNGLNILYTISYIYHLKLHHFLDQLLFTVILIFRVLKIKALLFEEAHLLQHLVLELEAFFSEYVDFAGVTRMLEVFLQVKTLIQFLTFLRRKMFGHFF